MISAICVAMAVVPVFASASEACSNRHDHPMKQGASLIQTLGTIRQAPAERAPAESTELSAFDKDYILDGNNPLDAPYTRQLDALGRDYISDANNPLDASSADGSGQASASTASASQPAEAQSQLSSSSMDAWERDLLVNGRGGQAPAGTPSSYDWSSMRIQGAREVCVTREDAQATHIGYTTAPAGTTCIFGLDARDEGSHCIMSDGVYGSLGWCFTSQAKDTFGSCSESCPLFGPAKMLGDRIQSLDASVREHQAWERWIATSSTSTVSTTTAAANAEIAQVTATISTAAPTQATAEQQVSSSEVQNGPATNTSAIQPTTAR